MFSKQERIAMINELSMDSTIRQVVTAVSAVFISHFGITTDASRLEDIKRESLEFLRALSRVQRLGELGDVVCSLLAFVSEQEVDLAAKIKQTLLKIEGRAEIYAARGDKKNVAILGGSFDPPTRGHLALAKAVLDSTIGINEVWFMPPGNYEGSKRLSDPRHRAAMCRLLEKVDPRIKFFGYEMDHALGGETRHTLLRLLEEVELTEAHRFYFIVSTETASTLTSWPNSDELKRAITFITVPRPGYSPDLRDPWFIQQPHVFLNDAQGLLEISSTDVRKAIAANDLERAGVLLTPDVLAYIRENGLYV